VHAISPCAHRQVVNTSNVISWCLFQLWWLNISNELLVMVWWVSSSTKKKPMHKSSNSSRVNFDPRHFSTAFWSVGMGTACSYIDSNRTADRFLYTKLLAHCSFRSFNCFMKVSFCGTYWEIDAFMDSFQVRYFLLPPIKLLYTKAFLSGQAFCFPIIYPVCNDMTEVVFTKFKSCLLNTWERHACCKVAWRMYYV